MGLKSERQEQAKQITMNCDGLPLGIFWKASEMLKEILEL